MKKFSKQTAIILSAILGFVLIVGLIFSFVPMKFGNTNWNGFSNSINISSDLVGGVYGEFEIKTEDDETISRADIEQSKTIIRDVLSSYGYKNANVYDVAGEKIRVELSYPKGLTINTEQKYQEAINNLRVLTNGKFMLQNESSVTETSVVVDGTEGVESVELKTTDSLMAVVIKFNETGKAQYEALCNKVASSGSIYIALGSGSPQQINISQTISQGVYDYLELQSSSYDGIFDVMQKIKIGCMALEFKENTVKIDTMSASLSAGEAASSTEFASYFSSSNYVILLSAIVFVAVAILAFFAIKFGIYAVLIFVTMLINTVLFLILTCLVPSVEFGLSAYVAILIVLALIYTYAFDFAFAVRREYNNGKSINAALETAFKSKFINTIISSTIMFLSSLAFILLAFGELSSVGVVFAIGAALTLVTNIAVVPLLIKIYLSFAKSPTSLFMLKKHSIDELSLSNEIEEKEAE